MTGLLKRRLSQETMYLLHFQNFCEISKDNPLLVSASTFYFPQYSLTCHAIVAFWQELQVLSLSKDKYSKENMAEGGPSSAQQEPAQMPQLSYTEEEEENILADKDINIRDLILPIFDLYKAMQNVLNQNAQVVDHLNICQSRLINAVVPQVPNLP